MLQRARKLRPIEGLFSSPETAADTAPARPALALVVNEASPAYYTPNTSTRQLRELSPIEQMYAYYEAEAI